MISFMTVRESKRFGWRLRRGIALFCIVAGVLFTALFLLAVIRDGDGRVVDVRRAEEGPYHIGESVTYRVVVECPWHRLPVRPFDVQPPLGVQLLAAEQRQLCRIGLGTWRWACLVRVQPYELGETDGGSVTIRLTPGRKGNESQVGTALSPLAVAARLRSDEEAGTLHVSSRLFIDVYSLQARWLYVSHRGNGRKSNWRSLRTSFL